MRVAILGGAGFIGSALSARLVKDGHEVVIFDDLSNGSSDNVPRGAMFIHRDVTDGKPGLWADLVYNLASPTTPKRVEQIPVQTLLTNVLSMRFAAGFGGRVVLASSAEIYGQPDALPIPETYAGRVHPCGVRACYDEGKRAAEALAMAYKRQYGCDVGIARLFNAYGPRMSAQDGRIVPQFIRQALAGEPLTVYGDGQQTRSLCYVDDTVEALVRLGMQDRCTGPINIGGTDETTVLQIAAAVLELTGSDSEVKHVPAMTDDPQRRCPDIAEAQRLLRWAPSTSLVDGLENTIEWMETHGSIHRNAHA